MEIDFIVVHIESLKEIDSFLYSFPFYPTITNPAKKFTTYHPEFGAILDKKYLPKRVLSLSPPPPDCLIFVDINIWGINLLSIYLNHYRMIAQCQRDRIGLGQGLD